MRKVRKFYTWNVKTILFSLPVEAKNFRDFSFVADSFTLCFHSELVIV